MLAIGIVCAIGVVLGLYMRWAVRAVTAQQRVMEERWSRVEGELEESDAAQQDPLDDVLSA